MTRQPIGYINQYDKSVPSHGFHDPMAASREQADRYAAPCPFIGHKRTALIVVYAKGE